jgi:hypothetical protein
MTTGDYGDQPGQPQYGPPPGQPQYGPPPGQPQYGPPPGQPPGQPQYGPPPGQGYGPHAGGAQYGGYGPPPAAQSSPASGRETFGVVAAALAAVAAVAGVLSLTVVDWFNGGNSLFSDVRKVVTSNQTKQYATGLAKVFYGWLAWVLLAVVVILAVVAASPNVGRPFRAVGAIVAVASIVVAFLAIKFFNSNAGAIDSEFNGYSAYIKHARAGFWMFVAALLIGGIAAAIGARRNPGPGR